MVDENAIKETLMVGGVGLVSLANLFTKEEYKLAVIILGLAIIGLRGYLKSKWQAERDAVKKNETAVPLNP